jgi:hypothetical protein
MDYDLDYFGGKDLVYPKTPIKPRLDPKADSTTAMAYARDLAVYESAMISYRELKQEYSRLCGQRQLELQDRLRDDYDLAQAQFDLLWNKAWEDGHSNGLHSVVYYFEEFYELATKFAALEG